jgi:cytochrome P450
VKSLTIDLNDMEYRLRPWRLYQRLRDEVPVQFVPEGTADGEDFYIISRYDDVSTALRDKTVFSNQVMLDEQFNLPVLVNRDAPVHTRLRQNANHAFNARLVRTIGEWVQEVIEEILDKALACDRAEWVEQFSAALPLRVVGDMLGIPLDRKNDFRRWTEAVMNMFAVAAGLDPGEVPGFFEDVLEFAGYMEQLANERKGAPPKDDILAALVVQHEAGNLARDEMVIMAVSFIAAGHETTMNLLSGGLQMLLTDHALAGQLRANPDRTEEFIDEYLRMFGPIQWTLRRTTQDVELHGVRIPRGSLVHLLIGSANRDDRKFPGGDQFDLDRVNKADHVAFGAGPHFCPGAALTRLLSGLAFRAYYRRLDQMSLDPADPPKLRTRQGAYGFETVPILVKH